MTNAHERAKEIFLDALDLDDAERSLFVRQACQDNEDVRTRVEALLRAHQNAGRFMDSPDQAQTEAESRIVVAGEAVGDLIGPYRLIEKLGAGGFGAVFLAEQAEPVKRQVAIKLIKPGMDTAHVIARFDQERQALARMDHPGIARVYDAGATDRGRPYFVMEYVRGEPITTWCDRRRLRIAERLALFVQVCHAVQHAHQKGVIHRDIKPGNVLVADIDGTATPKVIDFGIAKATGERLVERTIHTAAHQMIGTPEYMAPEQAAGEEDIDTRADVYSLGVLLYELLTGLPLYDRERLRNASVADLERMIRQEEPRRPSARIQSLNERELAPVAIGRNTGPTRLVRELTGDIDWIVMKAVEKDRERRYATAFALAADIQRHLRNEPVEAGPPSAMYRLSRFVKRRRMEVAATGAVAAALGALVVFSLLFGTRAIRAERAARLELDKYQAIVEFNEGLLAGMDPAIARDADKTLIRLILANAAQRVETDLKETPAVEVAVRNTIGYTYFSIGVMDAAEEQFRTAATLAEQTLPPLDPLRLRSEAQLARVLIYTGRLADAAPLVQSVVERSERAFGPDDERTIEALSDLAALHERNNRPEEAEALNRRVLAARVTLLGESHEKTITSMNNLANALDEPEEMAEAITLLEQVLKYQENHNGLDHPKTLATANNLATAYRDTGRTDEARKLFLETLAIKKRILPPGHPSVIISMVNLSDMEETLGRLDEAEALLLEAVTLAREHLGENDFHTLGALNNLASLYIEQDRFAEALPLAETCARAMADRLGPEHRHTLGALGMQATALVHLGRLDEALPLVETLPERTAASLQSDTHDRVGSSLYLRGKVRAAAGRLEEAEADLRRAREITETAGVNARRLRHIRNALADICERTNRLDEAAQHRAAAANVDATSASTK